LILIAPHATNYDIDTTGDPTYTGNYILKGTHRIWASVKNTHASASSILKFTGKASIQDLAFFQTAAINGVIFTNSGFRVSNCGFNAESATGANTSIHLDGATTITGGKFRDVEILGNKTYTTGILMDNAAHCELNHVNIHTCLTGLQQVGADSDGNYYEDFDIGDTTLALDIDAGNKAHFNHINFHANTANVDDEVGDHIWSDIHGEFEISTYPEDLSGEEVTAGNGTWGSNTEIRAAATATVPFKVVAYQLSPSNDETTLIRFSADGGTTHFTESIFASKKNKAAGSGDATDFIFNKGNAISASVWSPAADRTVDVWLDIQEI